MPYFTLGSRGFAKISAMEREKLLHLCELARLTLAESELEAFAVKFGSMLGFVEQMMGYEPHGDAPPLTLIDKLEFRPDMAVDAQWPAGTVHDYQVPRIIDFAGGED
jgi:aspartyl/glutamyl-tRNA(Asn/Gln) amidotransferase C subunit